MPKLADYAAIPHAGMEHVGTFDNERIRKNRLSDIANAPGRFAQGAFTGIVGGPVELANMALKPFGLGSERPIGGMNHLASLINADTKSIPYQAGTMLPLGVDDLGVGAMALAGIFAGKGAKTADIAKLGLAQEMAKKGIPDELIHKETGWF